MTPPTLNLVGAGRVGQTLAHLWHQRGTYIIQDVLTTHPESAQAACVAIGAGNAVNHGDAMRPADVWMLAVPDAHIASAAMQLQNTWRDGTPSPVAFHCSGALAAAQLAPLADKGWHTASAHCILSFASVPAAVAQFNGTPCALEGHAVACEHLRTAFTAIGAQCFDVASAHKVLYHAAAVFATNFLPVLQSVAEDAWHATGVPPELIVQLRAALLHNATANIIRQGPAGALTGPAARGDRVAIAHQAQVVSAWNPDAGAAYAALSQLALRMKASLPPCQNSDSIRPYPK
jgi:predicted short-subunit dehydrogenase-like oxidoreductase (DUF2520 family)